MVEWQSSTPHPDKQVEGLQSIHIMDGYTDYTLSEELNKLIEGKRVVFVCPSPHLKGQGKGSYIDSFDVVVRIHQHGPIAKEDVEDYGSRCDILVSCMNIFKIQAMLKGWDYVTGRKFILCPQVSCQDVGRVDHYLKQTLVPHQNVDDGYLFKTFKEIGTTANTGLMTILTLLHYPMKELHITGMTFYNMNSGGDVYTPQHQKDLGQQAVRLDIHHQQPQIDYFRKVVEEHHGGVLTLDDYLTEYFV